MKLKSIFFGATLASLSLFAVAAGALDAGPIKGTVCFANQIRDTEKVPILCKGLGKFANVSDLYERGYRVVSSTVLQEAGVNTVVFFIEERK